MVSFPAVSRGIDRRIWWGGWNVPVEHVRHHLQLLLGSSNLLRTRLLRLAKSEERHFRLDPFSIPSDG